MINMSAKFDKETRNGVVSIMFTMRDYQESVTIGQTDTRTRHRQTPDKEIPMCRYASQATQLEIFWSAELVQNAQIYRETSYGILC